jgi:hypothetical protein
MTVEDARSHYQEDALVARLGVTCWRIEPAECNTCKRFLLAVDAASIALDLAVSEAHRTDWRTRQAAIWADREHKALMKSVAWA